MLFFFITLIDLTHGTESVLMLPQIMLFCPHHAVMVTKQMTASRGAPTATFLKRKEQSNTTASHCMVALESHRSSEHIDE